MPGFFVHPDIARAQTLDADFYTRQEHFEAAKEKIFVPSWQFIGDASDAEADCSAYPFTLLEHYLNEPLLLLKDVKGHLRCMSNVCTHRGNILVGEPCKLHHIRCKYHGRQFALDGKLVSMPEFKAVEGFPSDSDNLHVLPLFNWGSLLFTSLNASIEPKKVFGEMMQRMDWYPMDKLRYMPDQSRDYQVAANWALYCENYLEGFHIPFVHESLNHEIDFGSYTTELFRYSNLQVGIGKKEDACFDLPPSSPDFGRNVAAYYFWVFPNMMFNFYPWGLSVNIVQPTGVTGCKVSFLTYVLDEKKMDVGAGVGLDTIEMEDEEIVQQVQRGVGSRFYKYGRYSVTREQGTHHFHLLVSEFMNR